MYYIINIIIINIWYLTIFTIEVKWTYGHKLQKYDVALKNLLLALYETQKRFHEKNH
jgi:uncharacterized protein YebE (UPF0316 family)